MLKHLIAKLAKDFIRVTEMHPELSIPPYVPTIMFRSMTFHELKNAIRTGNFRCLEAESAQKGWEKTSDWTIDPSYWYQGDEKRETTRVTVSFEKVLKEVGKENILNLLHDGESEIRVRLPISLNCLVKVEFLKVQREKLNLNVPVKIVEKAGDVSEVSERLRKYYDAVYAKYGVEPIKPYGNTWQ